LEKLAGTMGTSAWAVAKTGTTASPMTIIKILKLKIIERAIFPGYFIIFYLLPSPSDLLDVSVVEPFLKLDVNSLRVFVGP